MSERRTHPNFEKKCTFFTLSCASLAVISIGLCFYFDAKGSETLPDVFIGLFAFFTLLGAVGTMIKLYTVRCYACGGPTNTIKNTEEDMWQAHCSRCDITWDLGIGIDTD